MRIQLYILLEQVFIFKQHKIKHQKAILEFYKKQPLILGAAVERCSGSMSCIKLSCLQLYLTGVFENFRHILLTCSRKFIKILKVGKIFRCVTSFHQYFFVSHKLLLCSIRNIIKTP